MLFSEMNYTKNEVFSKSFAYAAEFIVAVSFNNIFQLKLKYILFKKIYSILK